MEVIILILIGLLLAGIAQGGEGETHPSTLWRKYYELYKPEIHEKEY
jgi:hypothetical protein